MRTSMTLILGEKRWCVAALYQMDIQKNKEKEMHRLKARLNI